MRQFIITVSILCCALSASAEITIQSVSATAGTWGQDMEIEITGTGFDTECHSLLIPDIDITPSSHVQTISDATSVDVSENLAFVSAGFNGLFIVDTTNSLKPVLLGMVDIPGNALKVVIHDNIAYVASGARGLYLIEASDPGDPKIIDSIGAEGYVVDLTFLDNTIFLSDEDRGLVIVDVHPSIPIITQTIDSYGPVFQTVINNNIAFIASCHNGLMAMDINKLHDTTPLHSIESLTHISGMTLYNQQLLVAQDYKGIGIIDISEPDHLSITHSIDTPGFARKIQAYDTIAYVADFHEGIQLIDLSYQSPLIVGRIETSGAVTDIKISDHKLLVADQYTGLNILAAPRPAQIINYTETHLQLNIPSPELPGHYYLKLYNQTSSEEIDVFFNALPETLSVPANSEMIALSLPNFNKHTCGSHTIFSSANESLFKQIELDCANNDYPLLHIIPQTDQFGVSEIFWQMDNKNDCIIGKMNVSVDFPEIEVESITQSSASLGESFQVTVTGKGFDKDTHIGFEMLPNNDLPGMRILSDAENRSQSLPEVLTMTYTETSMGLYIATPSFSGTYRMHIYNQQYSDSIDITYTSPLNISDKILSGSLDVISIPLELTFLHLPLSDESTSITIHSENGRLVSDDNISVDMADNQLTITILPATDQYGIVNLGVTIHDQQKNIFYTDRFQVNRQLPLIGYQYVRTINFSDRFRKKMNQGMVVDTYGDTYFLDQTSNIVTKYDSDGNFMLQWGRKGFEYGAFNQPSDIAIDSNNFIYIADTGNHRVQVFTSFGQFLTSFGSKGESEGQLNNPSQLSINNDLIYVLDSGKNQVFEKVSYLGKKTKAIIVETALSIDNPIWKATQNSTAFAYSALIQNQIRKDNIFCLTESADNDISNVTKTTKNGLRYAITRWAEDADSLILYMVGQGGNENYRLNETEMLSSTVLDQWLDCIQEKMTEKLLVIYDSCFSGSFMPALSESPVNRQRIVMTASMANEEAIFLEAGTSFSHYFWSSILTGHDLGASFDKAVSELNMNPILFQKPLLNANGNDIYNESIDKERIKSLYAGNGFTHGEKPFISDVSPNQYIIDESAVLHANGVWTKNGIKRVWAEIMPPIQTSHLPEIFQKALGEVQLQYAGNNSFETTYSNFLFDGTYYVTYKIEDIDGDISIPRQSIICVNTCQHQTGDNAQLTIESISSSITLTEGSTATITVCNIIADHSVEKVLAMITLPENPHKILPTNLSQLPFITLTQTENTLCYTGIYEKYQTFGTYELFTIAIDEMGNTSQVLTTTIFQSNGPDVFEVDDTKEKARFIIVDADVPQRHTFHDKADEDWIQFYGISGKTYRIEVGNLNIDKSQPVIDFSGPDKELPTTKKVYESILYGEKEVGFFEWKVFLEGTYYVKVKNNLTEFGKDTAYDLSVSIPAAGFNFNCIHGQITDQNLVAICDALIAIGDHQSISSFIDDGTFLSYVSGIATISHPCYIIHTIDAQFSEEPINIQLKHAGVAPLLLLLQQLSGINSQANNNLYMIEDYTNNNTIGIDDVLYLMNICY
jgi:hypothetical protein